MKWELKALLWLLAYACLPALLLLLFINELPDQLPLHYTNSNPDRWGNWSQFAGIVIAFSALGLVVELCIYRWFRNKLAPQPLLIYSLLCGSIFILPLAIEILVLRFDGPTQLVDTVLICLLAIHCFLIFRRQQYLLPP